MNNDLEILKERLSYLKLMNLIEQLDNDSPCGTPRLLRSEEIELIENKIKELEKND